MSDFDELMERVQALTGLSGRDAAKVAFEFDPDAHPRPDEIVDKAIELGYDVERKHDAPADEPDQPFGIGICMDPTQVLTEMFMVMPRCVPVRTDLNGDALPVEVPKIGRVPDEAQRHESLHALLDELPEDMSLILAKIDVLEGACTFWVRDGANEIDRPIGPIDLTHYTSTNQIHEAFMDLLRRIPKVLAADSN